MIEHPYHCIEINNKNKWEFLLTPSVNIGIRQQYEDKYYFVDGNFYYSSYSFLRKYKSFFVKDKTSVFINNKRFSIDIDDEDDLHLARALSKYGT